MVTTRKGREEVFTHETPFPNMALDMAKRPLAGPDVAAFMRRFQLGRVTVVDALALATPDSFNKLSQLQKVLAFDLEVLIRLYDYSPGPAPWTSPTPAEVFEIFYGDLLRRFDGTEASMPARIMLYTRFAALFGRQIFSSYRWIDSDGKASGQINRIMSKIMSLPSPREEFERLVRQAYKLRGVDFDLTFPLPDPRQPPEPAKRGPAKGASRKRDDALVAEVHAAKAKAPPKKVASVKKASRASK